MSTGRDEPLRINLPNALTLLRIFLVPFLVVVLLTKFEGREIVGLIIFLIATATDFFDGWIARRRGEVSPLGVFMDLTADKVLVGGVLVAMVEVGLLPTWMVATILVRELVIAGVRQMAAAADIVIAAKPLGKAKTLTTLAGMGLLLLAWDAATGGPLAGIAGAEGALMAAGFWTMVVATALTLVSGWDYLAGAMPLLRGQRP